MTHEELLSRLGEQTLHVDQSGQWPAEQFQWLAEVGVLGWVIPREFGGSEIPSSELIQGYLQQSAACLTTTFILTQRNGACQRIAASENEALKSELLPQLATGKLFSTVGVSHLTTSRQHLRQPAVRVKLNDDTIELEGQVPWVTGAPAADVIVTGGTCEDGRQVILALPTNAAGVRVQQPAELMALTASHTASIGLNHVVLPRTQLLAGPIEAVMKGGSGGGAGSIVTSTLAAGLASRALDILKEHADTRDDLRPFVNTLNSEFEELRVDMFHSKETGDAGLPQTSVAEIRRRANSLVLRMTQAAMTASKGAGFVKGHLAELSAREALFFLVWSCPQPVLTGAMEEFACRSELA